MTWAGTQLALTFVLVIVWILSEVGVRRMAWSRGSPRQVPRTKDRGSGPFLLLCLALLFVAVIAYRLDPFWGYLPLWVRAIGDVLMALGIVLRVWAVQVLGKFFTTTVTIQGGHHLVSDGPYRVVRHPSYTGALTTLSGFFLAAGGLFPILLAVFLVPVSFGYRIKVEEGMLLEGLGEEYRAYMARTYRLFPPLL